MSRSLTETVHPRCAEPLPHAWLRLGWQCHDRPRRPEPPPCAGAGRPEHLLHLRPSLSMVGACGHGAKLIPDARRRTARHGGRGDRLTTGMSTNHLASGRAAVQLLPVRCVAGSLACARPIYPEKMIEPTHRRRSRGAALSWGTRRDDAALSGLRRNPHSRRRRGACGHPSRYEVPDMRRQIRSSGGDGAKFRSIVTTKIRPLLTSTASSRAAEEASQAGEQEHPDHPAPMGLGTASLTVEAATLRAGPALMSDADARALGLKVATTPSRAPGACRRLVGIAQHHAAALAGR